MKSVSREMDVKKKPNTDSHKLKRGVNNSESEDDVESGPGSLNSSQDKSEPLPAEDLDFTDQQGIQHMDPETQSRLKAFLEVAGVKLSHVDTRTFQDPEILRKLTNW